MNENESMNVETICFTILILIASLVFTMFLNRILNRCNFKCFHISALSTIVGIAVGLTLVNLGYQNLLIDMQNNFTSIFFIVLLPPIVFSSAYSSNKKVILKNFGTILTFSFLGTFLSVIIVTIAIYYLGKSGIIYELNLYESIAYASIISATDPRSVISLMKELNIDRTLFNIIFGEDIFNDAAAIVLFQTVFFVEKSLDLSYTEICFTSIGIFTFILLGSFAIGIVSGILTSFLIRKYERSIFEKKDRIDSIEVAFVLGSTFCVYMVTQGLGLSGIVAILIHGILLAQYGSLNLNLQTKRTVHFLINSISSVFESIIFIFLGMCFILFAFASFAFSGEIGWKIILINILIVQFSRLCCIIVSTAIVNKHRDIKPINFKYAFVIWHSGLRGSIAYILALKYKISYSTKSGDVILFLTVFYSILSILIQGSFSRFILFSFQMKDIPEDYLINRILNDKGELVKLKIRTWFEALKTQLAVLDEKTLTPYFHKPKDDYYFQQEKRENDGALDGNRAIEKIHKIIKLNEDEKERELQNLKGRLKESDLV